MPENPEPSAKRSKISTLSAMETAENPLVTAPWPFEDTPWPFDDEEAKVSTKSAVTEYPPVTEKWPWPPLEDKEAKIPTSAEIIAEYPPVTEHERGFVAPYLEKMAWEDEDEEVDDRGDKRHSALQTKKIFRKQVRESRGYDLTVCPAYSPLIPCPPPYESEEFNAWMTKASKFAIEHINADTRTKYGKYYQFLDLQYVVRTPTFTYFLTFKAWEFDVDANANVDANTPVRTFQAMVYAPPHLESEFHEWRFRPGSVAPKAFAPTNPVCYVTI